MNQRQAERVGDVLLSDRYLDGVLAVQPDDLGPDRGTVIDSELPFLNLLTKASSCFSNSRKTGNGRNGQFSQLYWWVEGSDCFALKSRSSDELHFNALQGLRFRRRPHVFFK
ncbi:hypothetical protein X743_03860 [Mesorhizobium sp. LNHC252B00]|nr:hypothetical protein X743_03860 [Mesorhizobium sp. LNHC252B00]